MAGNGSGESASSGRGATISVVVPAYNEEKVLPEFHSRLVAVLDGLKLASEVIYVNDGSRDGTLGVLDALRADDARIAIINLSRNFGKELAMTAGLDYARGDAAVVIDADLQDPPELIPALVKHWAEDGYDVVYAQRQSRAGEPALKRFGAYSFYRLMNRISRFKVPEDTGDFRLLSRRALEGLKELREHHRFMKGLFSWIGYRQIAVPYHRDPRAAGVSKWSYLSLWNFSIEGITGFSTAPLKFATYFGLVVAVFAFAFGANIIIDTLIFGSDVPGYPSLMVVVLLLGGIQLVTIGVLGEYVGRTFTESKRRPLYLIQDIHESALTAPKHGSDSDPAG